VPFGFDANNPYGHGKPTPWRAGANENTTITLAHDGFVENMPLSAGIYGLFMVVEPERWTIIFSKNSTSWGHFFYEEAEDALRVVVKPVSMQDVQERLSYGFDNTTLNETTAYMRWEKIKVPFRIRFDTPSIVVAHLKNQLRNRNAFDGKSLLRAANYCLQYDLALDQAAYWAERATLYGGGNAALFVKSAVLEKQGKLPEATSLRKKAIAGATENELNAYGYTLLAQKKYSEALEIFKANCTKHPKSWNVWDSLADAFDQQGDKKAAIENYQKALTLVTDAGNKQRIEGLLKRLLEHK
jgi:tetratricopeptide (TPR) repeat protein